MVTILLYFFLIQVVFEGSFFELKKLLYETEPINTLLNYKTSIKHIFKSYTIQMFKN